MLREDHNAHFLEDSRGFLFRKRIWFEGTGCPPIQISAVKFDQLKSARASDPGLVAIAGDRRYWWWEDAFYWENEGYQSIDVKALVTRSRRQKERSLQHAHALLAGEKVRTRDAVPDDVRRFVWKRDGGKCQECGSTGMLQYDHIIPWSLGGADTAENLRLLCADCNRLKSDSI
jgi:5-methylcytosine-specific restriction endonuclease McrA